MSTTTQDRARTVAEASEELGGLYSPSQLQRMCAAGEIPHHRGSRNCIRFFDDDMRDIKRAARRTPAPAKPALQVIAEEHEQVQDPFRTTSRSRAAHRRRTA